MHVRRVKETAEIVANDGCRLRELLHPDRDGDLPYSLAIAWVDPGRSTAPHRLLAETEVYYVVAGRGTMHVGAEKRTVEPGDTVVVPEGEEQWIECRGPDPLEILLVVSPPWNAENDVLGEPRR